MKYCSKIMFLLVLLISVRASDAWSQPHHDFVVFTPPKCGTHLIAKVMQLMLDEKPTSYLSELGNINEMIDKAKSENSFVVAHNFSQEMINVLIARGYKVIFILRDPRDHLVSMINWFREGMWGFIRAAHMTDQNEQIEELITGEKFGWQCFRCIAERFRYVEGLGPDALFVTRFENLVGPQGGSSEEIQLQEIYNLAAFVGIELSEEKALQVAHNCFGGTWTFRKGQTESWKEYFTKRHKHLYKLYWGPTLRNLGYEKNNNW